MPRARIRNCGCICRCRPRHNHHAIAFYREQFNVQRVVLPRVLSLSQVRHVIENATAEVEVFGFGSLCVMVEGRCACHRM